MDIKPGDWIVWRVEYLDHVGHNRAQVESVGQKKLVVKATGVGSGTRSHVLPSTVVFVGTKELATRLYLELGASKSHYDRVKKSARESHIERCNAIIAGFRP